MRLVSCLFAVAVLVAGYPVRAESPAVLLNLEKMVTADDYPAIAAANGQEGTAIVSVRVGRDGLVESCKIQKSSGYVALDEQSCAVFRARARFEPARNRAGRAMASTYERPMTWRLDPITPGSPPLTATLVTTGYVKKRTIT